jgi:hypothetical protein
MRLELRDFQIPELSVEMIRESSMVNDMRAL